MAEVAAVRASSGLTVISTFSGCGGSRLGFEMAGYDVRWANEFVVEAQRTYVANHPDVYLNTSDIRKLGPHEILEQARLRPGELDVLEGSPPCAAFSTARGQRTAGWGTERKYSDTTQRVDDLFDEYVRLLRGLQPRAFIAENVSGLVKGAAWGYFKSTMLAMRTCGYRVVAKQLDAQWLGVPQARPRLIFAGVRSDLQRAPVLPRPLGYRYTLRDAVPDIEQREPTRFASQGVGPRDFSRMPIGRRWRKLALGQSSKEVFTIWRSHPDRPCPTLLATCAVDAAGSACHPYLPRKFTIDELRALCSFPADFALTGSYAKQGERLGRAVPPLMMFRVARTLRDELFEPLGLVSPTAREVQL